MSDFVLNLFGYRTTYCKIAWYVRFYLELIILFPIVVTVINALYRKCKNKEVSITVFFLVNWILRVLFMMFDLPAITYVTEFLNYLPAVVMGYYIAWASVFEHIVSGLSGKKINRVALIGLYFVSFGCMFLLRGLLTGNGWFNIDVPLAPIFIGSTWYVLLSLENISVIKKVEKGFTFLGKYSLELWFLHAIFFIGDSRIQKIAYWPRVDILILIWTVLLLIPFAMLIQRIQKNVAKVVNSLGKGFKLEVR